MTTEQNKFKIILISQFKQEIPTLEEKLPKSNATVPLREVFGNKVLCALFLHGACGLISSQTV